MAPRYLSEDEAEVLRCHLRKKRSNASRPIFIFSCADKEDYFMLKRPFRDYIVHFIGGIVLALGLLFLCAAFKN